MPGGSALKITNPRQLKGKSTNLSETYHRSVSNNWKSIYLYIYIYTITVINAKSVACAAHIPTNYTSTKAVSPFQPRSHGYWWQFILTISTLLRDTLKIVALCFNALARMPNSGRVPSHVRCCAWDPTICLSVSDWIDSKHRCKNT